MRTLHARFEIHEADADTGIIEGLASATNVFIPGFDEKVMPGAFKKTLGRNKGKVPIFHMHRAMGWIGMGTHGKETDAGLEVKGAINMDVQTGREQFALIKQAKELNVRAGISIGFMSHGDEMMGSKAKPFRAITEVELIEWSITPPGLQANPGAKITEVRSLDQIQYDLEHLKPAQINDLIAHLRTAPHSPADSGETELDLVLKELQDLNQRLRS